MLREITGPHLSGAGGQWSRNLDAIVVRALHGPEGHLNFADGLPGVSDLAARMALSAVGSAVSLPGDGLTYTPGTANQLAELGRLSEQGTGSSCAFVQALLHCSGRSPAGAGTRLRIARDPAVAR